MSERTYTAEQTSTCNLGESVFKLKLKATYMEPKAAKPLLELMDNIAKVIEGYPNVQLDLLADKLNVLGPDKKQREAALKRGAGSVVGDGDDDDDDTTESMTADQALAETKPPPKKAAKKKAAKKAATKPGAGLPGSRNK